MPVFTRAEKVQKKLRMAITGPSGSGKTYSALAIASGLGAPIALIDTEKGGADFYADQFTFDRVQLESYAPTSYIKMLEAAEAERYPIVIIDSLSHEWMGEGGVLALVDKARGKGGNDFTAWRGPGDLHNKLIEAMLSSPFHLIVTLRSKMAYVLEEKNGKQVPKKLGLAPIQRDGLEYEMDVVGDLDLEHIMTVSKSRLHTVADMRIQCPGEVFGKHILGALTTGSDSASTVEVESQRRILLQEIRALYRDVIKPFEDDELYHAIFLHCFALAQPEQMKEQPVDVLQAGIGPYRDIVARLGTGTGKAEVLLSLEALPAKKREVPAGVNPRTGEDLRELPRYLLDTDDERVLAEQDAALAVQDGRKEDV
jgi:AAA domain